MTEKCSSHDMFERMLTNSLDNLAEKIDGGIKAMTLAAVDNGKDLKVVLANQAVRSEKCGQQDARINNLVANDKLQWVAIDKVKERVWIGMGLLVALQVAIPLVLHLIK